MTIHERAAELRNVEAENANQDVERDKFIQWVREVTYGSHFIDIPFGRIRVMP